MVESANELGLVKEEDMDMAEVKYEDIAVELDRFIGSIEIRRPPHNFFDVSLIEQIANALSMFDEEPDCRVVVLQSEGKSFCAGANFGSGSGDDSSNREEFTESGFRHRTGSLYEEGVRLFRSKKPIVAAIQGAAIGGGLGLSLVADFRVAAPEARFAANFVKLGIHPGFGLTETLPRLIGSQKANELFFTGRRVKGEEALEMGLVDRLVPLERLLEEARSFAAEIAENAPLAILSVRATTRLGLAEAVEKATSHELKEQQRLRGTRDAEEGIRAVAERRPGKFIGE